LAQVEELLLSSDNVFYWTTAKYIKSDFMSSIYCYPADGFASLMDMASLRRLETVL